jgi:hypothetical protein
MSQEGQGVRFFSNNTVSYTILPPTFFARNNARELQKY